MSCASGECAYTQLVTNTRFPREQKTTYIALGCLLQISGDFAERIYTSMSCATLWWEQWELTSGRSLVSVRANRLLRESVILRRIMATFARSRSETRSKQKKTFQKAGKSTIYRHTSSCSSVIRGSETLRDLERRVFVTTAVTRDRLFP